MKKFSRLSLLILFTLLFIACDDTNKTVKKDKRICPQCHMVLTDSNKHTATLENENITYFDDIGCMVLYAKKNNINLKESHLKVFTVDTQKYIDPFQAYYKIDEITPMKYGFGAYENKNEENTIDFNEVTIRMLRGEHMANPKIRKRLLGY